MGFEGVMPDRPVTDGFEEGTTVVETQPAKSSYDGFIQEVGGKFYVMLENGDAYEFSSFEEARDFLGFVCATSGEAPEDINTGHVMQALEELMGHGKAYSNRTYIKSRDIPDGLPSGTDTVVRISGFSTTHAKILDDTNGMGYLVPPSGVPAFTSDFFKMDPSLTPEQKAVASGILFAKVGNGVRDIYDYNFGMDAKPATVPSPNQNITKLVEAIWGTGTVPNEGHVAALITAGLLVYSDDASTNGMGEYHLTLQGNSFLKAGHEQTQFIPEGNFGGPDAMPDALAMPIYTTAWFQGEGTNTTLVPNFDLNTIKGALSRFADSLVPVGGHPTPYSISGLPEIAEGSPVDLLLDANFGTTTGRTVEQVQSLIAHGLISYDGQALTMTPKGNALLTGLQQPAAQPGDTTSPASGADPIAVANQTLATLLQWLYNNPTIMNLFDSAKEGKVDGYISWDDIGKIANRDPQDSAWAEVGISEDQAKVIIGIARALQNTGKVDANFAVVFDNGMMANGHGGFHTNWLPGFLQTHNPTGAIYSRDTLTSFGMQGR